MSHCRKDLTQGSVLSALKSHSKTWRKCIKEGIDTYNEETKLGNYMESHGRLF